MHDMLGWVSRLVTARPWLTLLVLLIVTVLMSMGSDLREPPLDTEGTLPRDSAVAKAMAEIDELFGDSGEVRVVTLLFRGAALTPGGLTQMDALLNGIASDPAVAGILAPTAPVLAPSVLVKTGAPGGQFRRESRRSRSTLSGTSRGSVRRSPRSPGPTRTARRSRSAASACTTQQTNAWWTRSAGSASW